MSTVLLTFANSEKGSPDYLESLSIESTEVDKILTPHQASNTLKIIREERATKDIIINKIGFFQDDIIVFLYSGHANSDKIFLEDGATNAVGLAGLLGNCPNLKLVILNGCSTWGQVQNLLDNGVPIVIATNRPIGDKKATLFCTTFFTDLSVHAKTIREAFDTAIQAAQLASFWVDFDVFTRGIQRKGNHDAPNWGIYCNENNENLLNTWRLPSRKTAASLANKKIDFALEKICKDYISKDISNKVDAALETLPYIISELLRSLKSGKAPNDVSSNVFYDTPSFARFERLLYTYRSIINLLVFVKLADLWNHKTHKTELYFDADFSEVLDVALLKDSGSNSNYILLTQLLDYYEKADLDCYVSESKALYAKLKADKNLSESVQYLEDKISEADKVKKDSANLDIITTVCNETEGHLSIVLYYFGFFVKYELLSVKDIELKKLRHQKNAQFFPRIAKLRLKMADSSEGEFKQDESAQIIDSSSVILFTNNSWKNAVFLNLSPFLIDKNALSDPKSTKAEVYYLASVAQNNESYDFRQVSRPDNYWNVRLKPIKKKNDAFGGFFDDEDEETHKETDCYALLRGQFDVLRAILLSNTEKK